MSSLNDMLIGGFEIDGYSKQEMEYDNWSASLEYDPSEFTPEVANGCGYDNYCLPDFGN